MENPVKLIPALSRSRFRRSFRLDAKDADYISRIGREKLKAHARDFIEKRLAPAVPENDGKQTPFRGHPVFKAQHATATCCRGCLEKWYKIKRGRELTPSEIELVVNTILKWIDNHSSGMSL